MSPRRDAARRHGDNSDPGRGEIRGMNGIAEGLTVGMTSGRVCTKVAG